LQVRTFLRGGFREINEPESVTRHGEPIGAWIPAGWTAFVLPPETTSAQLDQVRNQVTRWLKVERNSRLSRTLFIDAQGSTSPTESSSE
jgi:uncharacterized protein (DUF58 family)